MNLIDFPQSNSSFHAPGGLAETQVKTARAYTGKAVGGSVDGAPLIVTVWRPTDEELLRLMKGAAIFVSFMGDGLPPHFLTTSFEEATHPA